MKIWVPQHKTEVIPGTAAASDIHWNAVAVVPMQFQIQNVKESLW